jgi:tetratricopeptide (TPR) repeat protein
MMGNRRQPYPLIVLACLLLLTACGQTVPVRNARLELAAEHGRSAQRAYDYGDYQVALRQYEMALQIDVAIENVPGVAIDMLSLAKVNQKIGRDEVANAYLDKLLQDAALGFETDHLAAAAAQKSLLMMQRGDLFEGRRWLDEAVMFCAGKCGIANVIDNAQAAIALREKDADRALRWAERAASASRDNSPLEYANALRHLGEARLMRGEFAAALRLAEEALVVDKSQGWPEKIRQDLLLSASACDGQGDAGLASRYRERAARIVAR